MISSRENTATTDSSEHFIVVWQGVTKGYGLDEKYRNLLDIKQELKEDNIQAKLLLKPSNSTDDSFLKSTSTYNMNVRQNFRRSTFIETTLTLPTATKTTESKVKKSSRNRTVSEFKLLIKRVLERLRTSFSSSDKSDSFDSSYLDYHHLSLINRNSSVVSSISSQSNADHFLGLSRENRITRELKKLLPDMKDTVSAEMLMNMFVKDYYLNVPFLKEELDYEDIYKGAVKDSRVIFKLLSKRLNVFSNDLILLMKKEKTLSEKNMEVKVVDYSENDAFFSSSLAKNYRSILDEMTDDMKDINVFFYPVFIGIFEMIEPIDELWKLQDEELLKNEISLMSNELKVNRNVPCSLIRWKVMEFIRSSEHNYTLTLLLVQTCTTWLNNLLKCLFSHFSSVREETCIVLAYLMSRQSITNELLNCRQFDISFDIFNTTVRALEQYPENIAAFYCLIGFILQSSVNMEILDYIMEKGPSMTNSFMIKKWPKLLYYALKYWPYNQMVENPVTLRKIIDSLQLVIFRKNTKKAAKLTLLYLSRQFLIKTRLFTVWFDLDIASSKMISMQSTNGPN